MEIIIRKTGVPVINGDPGASDVTSTYRVTEDGREFQITFRSQRYGMSLGIAGEPGVLYTDSDSHTVHRRVLAVGRGCGIGVESDELVEGLSPWSIRAVILAHRREETGEIRLTSPGIDGNPERPAVFVDGRITDLHQHL